MPNLMHVPEPVSDQVPDEARASSGLHASSPKRSSRLQDLRQFGARLSNATLDLIFPTSCAGCGRVDSAWCARCGLQLQQLPIEALPQTLLTSNGELQVVSTGWHTDLLQTALQALKYENLPMLAQPLGARLAALLNELDWPVRLIVPVPMHSSRLRSRGYNQAALLAEALGADAGILVEPEALQRVRDTRSQVGLTRAERLDNMADAFRADEHVIRDHTLLLVDDVATTGATLRGCADALYAVGAAKVYALTVSAALGSLVPQQSLDLPTGDLYTYDNRDLSIR